MLSQSIIIVADTWYTLSFDYSFYCIEGPNGLALDIDGIEKATYSIYANNGWQTINYLFQAVGSSTHIAFRTEINGTDYDALIDNVSVNLYNPNQNPVPEPATMLLFGLGLLGLAGVTRKK